MPVHQAATQRSVSTCMRGTVAFIAVGAIAVIAAGAAEAGGWKGAALGWQYYAYGSPYNGLGSPGQCNVQGTATICGTFTGYFNIVTDAHSITFDYSPSAGGTWGKSGLSLPPTIHNGVAINLTSPGTIISVKVDPATNMVGFRKSRISFTANQIQVDWQRLPFDSSTVVKLNVGVANTAAGGAPAIGTIPAAAMAEHPTQKVKLTDNPPRH